MGWQGAPHNQAAIHGTDSQSVSQVTLTTMTHRITVTGSSLLEHGILSDILDSLTATLERHNLKPPYDFKLEVVGQAGLPVQKS